MKYLLVKFYSPTHLQRTQYLMSEEEFDLNFFKARINFIEEFGENENTEIVITYSDVSRWEK